MNSRSKIIGGILCGGKARRMNGFPKGNILVQNQTIITRTHNLLAEWCQQVLLVGKHNAYSHYRIPMIEDIIPNLGPAGGIYTLLKYFSTRKGILVCPCDMPFISSDTLKSLITTWQSENADIVVVADEKKFVPVVGLYSTSILNKWEELLLKKRELRLYKLIENFHFVSIKVKQKELFNLNSDIDLQYLSKIIKTTTNG